jgi:hypothetical protein
LSSQVEDRTTKIDLKLVQMGNQIFPTFEESPLSIALKAWSLRI